LKVSIVRLGFGDDECNSFNSFANGNQLSAISIFRQVGEFQREFGFESDVIIGQVTSVDPDHVLQNKVSIDVV
jgi:hypothetical protein